MSYRIECFTLYDIYKTGVLNRPKPVDCLDEELWRYQRNTQANFDTIVQAISLRSQPDIVVDPYRIDIRFDDFDNFGFLYQQIEDETYPCWVFEFEIQHASIFNDGINELGHLYTDCDQVPMIRCGTEWDKLPYFLDSSVELRNIYFKIKND